MKLFSVKKVGVFLDTATHGTERRPDGETKILILNCRVQPFDAKLASAVSDVVRANLFKLNHPDPKPELRRVDFALGVPRQQLHVFASTDTTKATLMFDQVKVSGTYARTEKNVNGYAFCFRAAFGPCSDRELQYAEEWRLGHRFVSFETAEPGLFDEDEEETEADEGQQRPRDMWEEGDEQNPHAAVTSEAEPVDAAEAEGDPPSKREPARRTKHRHADRKTAARAKQAKGRKR
jgi:hypothetical protein